MFWLAPVLDLSLSRTFVATIRRTTRGTPMAGFRSHDQALGRPLGISRLGLFCRLTDLDQKPRSEPPTPRLRRTRAPAQRPRGPKFTSGSGWRRTSSRASGRAGRGYNVRVEEALRAAGFGAKAKKHPQSEGHDHDSPPLLLFRLRQVGRLARQRPDAARRMEPHLD